MEDRYPAEAIRAFVAIRMGSAIDRAVAQFQEHLRALHAGVSWTSPDNFHLTLRFLGTRVEPATIAAIRTGLARVAGSRQPFVVEVSGAGAFPSLARPRVIWVGLRGNGLNDLAGAVECLAVACGLPAEPRSYTPHLTIGRVRTAQRLAALREPLAEAYGRYFGNTLIDEIILYQSLLSPRGAGYRELARFALTGAE